MSSFLRAAVIACLALLPAAAVAAGDQRVVNILFESRHLDLIGKGAEVTYSFERKGSNERLVGKDIADSIRLGVESVNGKGERNVVFKIFTGSNARDPQNWPDLTINPLFVWYLDRAVDTFNMLAGGHRMYAKYKIREALRDKGRVEETTIMYNGKEVPAYKVTVAPFADDINAHKMEGYQNSVFTIVVSNQVPGYFVDLHSTFKSTQAVGPEVEEHIKLVGMGEAK